MIEIISEGMIPSSKERECNASLWLNESIEFLELTYSELKSFAKAKKNGFKIQKGERHLFQEIKQDGKIERMHSIKAIHDICINHDIYCE